MKRLSDAQAARFGEDGVVFPLRLFPAEDAAGWLAKLEAIEAARAGRLPPSLNAKPHLLIPWAWDIVHDPRVLDAVEDLLGPDLLCWATSFIVKNADDPRYVAWHQDATYWGLSEPKAVTVWIALTPSTRENGCVRMLTGTHRQSLPHTDTRDPKNLLGRRERVASDVDDSAAVDVVLAPGEASLHDALILHGSNPNRSESRRIGFSVRYIPASLRHVGEGRNSATLVRGRDHGTFDLEQKPESEFAPEAVARHSDVLRRAMTTIFRP
ncbi:MAG TPA: phytanoyl-CoA dioxygenase family protein [Rhizomicrobium sp.]|nr:phytanoyl-CoA dioxygenase family protein [Rhizomicrobium sp.]